MSGKGPCCLDSLATNGLTHQACRIVRAEMADLRAENKRLREQSDPLRWAGQDAVDVIADTVREYRQRGR